MVIPYPYDAHNRDHCPVQAPICLFWQGVVCGLDNQAIRMFQIKCEPAAQVFSQRMQSAWKTAHFFEIGSSAQIVEGLPDTLRIVSPILADKPLAVIEISGIAVVEKKNIHVSFDTVNPLG